MSGIPSKITLDGKEYDINEHPELKNLVQSTRKDEKDKLYSNIASYQAQIKTLEDEKKANGELSKKDKEELEKLKSNLATAKAEQEVLQKQIDETDKADKTKKPADESLTADKVQDIVKNALAEQKKEYEKEIEALKGDRSKDKVEEYRKEQLAKHSGLIIEDFVPTNLTTKEEVNKAIETALAKSKKYIRKEYDVDGKKQELSIEAYEALEKERKEKEDKTPPYTPPTPPTPPVQGLGDLSDEDLLAKVSDMTDEEYEKNRSAILAASQRLEKSNQ